MSKNDLKTYLVDMPGKQVQITLCSYHEAGAKVLGWNPRASKGIPDDVCYLCKKMQPYIATITEMLND